METDGPMTWPGTPIPSDNVMTAQRAAYFMRRFKTAEKLLGPNEQAAIDYVLAMLSTPQPPQAERVPQADLSDGEIYSRISKVVDARLNVKVPMTDAEIEAMWQAHVQHAWGKVLISPTAFARAVERHHDIGEKP